MNERIKQFAEQAGAILEKGYIELSDGQLMLSDNVDLDKSNLNLEKFAELIVRECLGACSKQAADWEGEYADAHNDGVGSCISGIKEHFGVEWELNDVS